VYVADFIIAKPNKSMKKEDYGTVITKEKKN
jgi:hypothetical protein